MIRSKKSNSKKHQLRATTAWGLRELETRLMLAGDAGAAVASTVTDQPAAEVGDFQLEETHRLSSETIVFVDAGIENLSELTGGIGTDAELILLNSSESGIEQISQVLSGRSNVQDIHIIAHGAEGNIRIGDEIVNEESLVDNQDQIRGWRAALGDGADILLYSCETGRGQVGANFITRLAALSGADVAASTDLTGGKNTLGDWDLEATVGTVDATLVINQQTRDRYSNTLDITIRAAGVTGEEEMRLLVGGEVIQTWTVGGDAYGDVFETYSVDLDGVNADDVRIEFTNDLLDEETGVDRNLRVDSITIDGVVYETEDPSVFSNATWKPEDGITPGFRESEYLHTDGYFQYAGSSQPEPTGSLIRISAFGDEGDEEMSLVIGGETVQTFTVTAQEQVFTYQASTDVAVEDVQVFFTNDSFDPEGIDRNLNVDYIEVDDVRYESEAPTTFSTGSWLAEDGIVPGFGRSETLNANGFFRYAEPTVEPPVENQIQIAASGSEGGETMALVIDGETVQTWDVTTTQAVYTYQASSGVAIEDIRVEFTNDVYDPDNNIDANLNVDYLQLGDTRYETEAPTTFSTGTWLPADGVQPGFRQSETLHVNGYFQYAVQSEPAPPLLVVNDASGQQGSTINLDIALNLPEGSDGGVIISNVPSGAVIQSNGNDLDSFEDRVLVTVDDLAGLTITPASDFAGSILLNVEGIALDGNLNETVETSTLTVAVAPTDGNFPTNGTEERDTIIVYEGNTNVDGLGGNDVLLGLDSDDQLKGGEGDDVLIGGVGADILDGDAGNDLIEGGLGTDTLLGDAGNDRLFGGGGDDNISAGDGDDEIVGGLGNDVIDGGAGTDTVVLEGARAQYVVQEAGDGFAFVGPGGTDTVFNVEFVQFADVTVPIASINDPSFVGTPLPSIDGATEGDDTLTGSLVVGRGGDDAITGTAGDDILLGGTGVDQINAGDGDDFIQGDAGNDVINADGGNDLIAVDGGVDTIDGGIGYDTISFSQASSGATIDLSIGRTSGGNGQTFLTSIESAIGSSDGDVFRFDALAPGDYYAVDATAGIDILELKQFRRDQVSVQGSNIQIFFDGGGTATIDAYNVEFVELLDATIQTSDGDFVEFNDNDLVRGNRFGNFLFGGKGDDRVLGEGGNDYINGGSGDDVLFGGTGNDNFDAGSGDDTIFGEEGDDTIKGEEGNDRITDGIGNNTINGGDGFDTLVLNGSRADFNVEVLSDGRIRISSASGSDTVENIENFEFNGDGFSVGELLNNNPVAIPDSFSGPANIPIGGSVAPNDFDPDGDTIVFALAVPPQNGTLQFSPTGAFLYVPNPGFVGVDTFVYAATDINGGVAAVPVTITITA